MIPTILLFSALNVLALAAPASHDRRACNAKHHHHNGTLSISASGSGTSTTLHAVAAVAQGQAHKSTSTRYHTTNVITQSSTSTAYSTTVAVIHSTAVPPPVRSSAISSAVVKSTAKSSVAPALTSTATTPSNGKLTLPAGSEVGIGWNGNSGSKLDSFISAPGSKLSWYTGWNYDQSSLPAAKGLELVPQVWGRDSIADVYAQAQTWPASTKAILSFNEPNQPSTVGGCDMPAGEAATKHIAWVNNLKEKKNNYLIGAPGISRVDPNAQNWLDDWITACAGQCVYDFIPIPFYGTDVGQLTDYTDKFYAKYKKPLWITEFACWDFNTDTTCNAAQTQSFITTATQHWRGPAKGSVARWAWFGAWPDMASGKNANGLEDTSGAANAMGKLYVSS